MWLEPILALLRVCPRSQGGSVHHVSRREEGKCGSGFLSPVSPRRAAASLQAHPSVNNRVWQLIRAGSSGAERASRSDEILAWVVARGSFLTVAMLTKVLK